VKARQVCDTTGERAARSVVLGMNGGPLGSAFYFAVHRKPFNAAALAGLDADLAEARDGALKLVLRLEDLEEKNEQLSAELKQAATEAVRVQRRAALVEARRNLLVAQDAERNAVGSVKAELVKKAAE